MMFMAVVILIFSTGLFFFYLQILCQRILRQEFDQPYYRAILEAAQLEFVHLRSRLEEDSSAADYAGLLQALHCDFLALTYLMKHLRGLTVRDRLLLSYARTLFLSLAVRHILKLRLEPAVHGLTAISQYFANVVGQQMQVFSPASEPVRMLRLD
jgi:hypothetical protein